MSARIRITKRTVDRLVGEGAEHFYWDHALPGFGLRIRASGRKFYVAQFRAKGRLRRVTLGPHGALSPDVARQRARELISEAKAGRDPTSRREAERKAVTMADVADRFLDEYVSVHCKPGTAYEYRRLLDHHIRPKLGDRHVADVQRSDIAALHHAARKAPYQANRLLSVLSKMFNLAELWGLRADGSNPCRHVRRYKEEPRERFLSSEEFQRLGKVLDEILEEGSETRSAVVAIRLLMLTGCRRSEIQKLRWEHVDLKAAELQLTDSKTGGRTVPLSPSAVRLLASLPREDDNPWVIVGRKRGAHLTDLEYPWRRIRARAGLHDVRIHDLRHSFASRALALGEGLPMIGKLLGHTQVQTTARYAHLARDTMKVSAARIGDSIDCDLDADGEVAERPAA
ncbi:MAG: tyrosine-type recombinase/integrase [Rhodospirillales bacterium]|nr:tyrosine-type recombinase/integrase [Rhodospirillales bacterium]